MSAFRLGEVLELCSKIAEMNSTRNHVHELASFIRKNRRRIIKETKIARSKKRRTFGKLEGVIIELFMKLCNYTCPKYNVVLVHQVMTMLGYGGYDGDNRFRQRTENTLKKRKRIRNSIEEEEAFQDFSFDEPEENEMSGSIMSKSRSRNLAGVHKKTTKSKDDHSSCLRMSEEEKTTMEVSGDCSSPVLVSSVQVSSNTGAIALPRALPTFDLDISPSYQYREEEYFSDIIDDYRCVFNRDNNVSESFYDFYDFY